MQDSNIVICFLWGLQKWRYIMKNKNNGNSLWLIYNYSEISINWYELTKVRRTIANVLEESILQNKLYTFDLQNKFLNNRTKERNKKRITLNLLIKFANYLIETLATKKSNVIIIFVDYGHQCWIVIKLSLRLNIFFQLRKLTQKGVNLLLWRI